MVRIFQEILSLGKKLLDDKDYEKRQKIRQLTGKHLET